MDGKAEIIASVKSLISFFFHIIILNELDDRNACKDKLSILSGESSSGNFLLEFEHTHLSILLSLVNRKIALLMKIMSMGAR